MIKQIRFEQQKNNSNWNGRTSWSQPVPVLNQLYEQNVNQNNSDWHRNATCYRCNNVNHIARNCQLGPQPRIEKGRSQEGNRGNRRSFRNQENKGREA